MTDYCKKKPNTEPLLDRLEVTHKSCGELIHS